jgi:hypothetical protein
MLAYGRTRRACAAACLTAGAFATNPSSAAEWSMESSAALRTEYDSNIELTSAPHSSVWGVLLAPEMRFSGETETLKITGGLRLSINHYFGESRLNSTDHQVTVRSNYKTERDIFGLDVDSVRDSTLVSELLETGVVQARRQRDRLAVNPSWRRSLTETMALTASYGYSDVRYDDTRNTSLTDYRDQTASVGLLWNPNERGLVTLSGYYDWYETDPKAFEAKTYGLQARYDHAFSETLHGALAIGARNTQSRQTSEAFVCSGPILFGLCFGTLSQVTLVASDRSTGYTFLGSIERKFETALVTGQMSREIYPTGVGALVQTDRLGLTWQQELSPTLSFFVDASIYDSRYVGNFVTGSNSRYYRIEPRLTWKMADNWTLLGGYSYARVQYEDTSASASANTVYVVVSYTWPKLAISR